MSVTSGFYDSLNGDRKYNTSAFSKLISNLVTDGVFASIGTAFSVSAAGGLNVTVGIGKAWFNDSWILNDSILPLTTPDAELLLNRIDAVVLEFDSSIAIRDNSIKVVKGVPATNPVSPELSKSGFVHQYPLCYIYRASGSTAITQAEITNMIGTNDTPFITGILQTVSLDVLLGQWRAQLDQFVASETADIDAFMTGKETEFNTWMNTEKSTFSQWKNTETTEFNQWRDSEETNFTNWFNQMKTDLTAEQALLDEWVASEQADFLAWYQEMKGKLGEDPAGNLQLQLDKEEVNRILLAGFVDGSKSFSDDGTVITSTATDGRILTKTFTNGFLTMTSILKSTSGADVAKMVKTFAADGKLIDTVVTYY